METQQENAGVADSLGVWALQSANCVENVLELRNGKIQHGGNAATVGTEIANVTCARCAAGGLGEVTLPHRNF